MKRTKHHIQATLCATLFATLASLPATAQTVPPLINYQGKLVNSNSIPLPTGDYELHFSIWDAATGGTQVWGPQVFNGQTGPGLGPKVPVVQGWFNVMLGPVDTNGASLLNAFTATNRFVQVQVASNPPLALRQQIVSAPFALRAHSSGYADTALFATMAGTATIATNVLNGVPPGTVLPFASAQAPSGFLRCDGRAVSRLEYSALFAVVGTTFGAGDGSTTFNIPNIEGRFIVGVNSAEPSFANVAHIGGELAHNLTYNEMPSHSHGDIMDWEVTDAAWANENYGNPGDRFAVANVGLRTGSRLYSQFTTSSAGGGMPHSNLPPYLAMNYIIKF